MSYPNKIDPINEFERRLANAIRNLEDKASLETIDSVRFALHVDTNTGGNRPSMRPEFVWTMMDAHCGKPSRMDHSILVPWIQWWRQRWHQRPHMPDFDGMNEHTRRGLCVQMAKLSEHTTAGSFDIHTQSLRTTINILLNNSLLSWREIVELSEYTPSHSILAERTINSVYPSFPVGSPAWSFTWKLLNCIYPKHEAALNVILQLSDTYDSFGTALDDFFATSIESGSMSIPDGIID